MSIKRFLLCFAGAGFIASSALAAPCSGFTDVDSASGFCPNVDWLKNRAITLGCTSATLYCPTDPVVRLQMAAFMNRLGTSMTPEVLFVEQTIPAHLNLDASIVTCNVNAGTKPYPRSAQVGALMSALFATSGTMALTIMQSTNGGITWTPLHAIPGTAGGANKWFNATAWSADVPLAAGTEYRFGLQLDRAGGTGDIQSHACQMKAVVTSRTGSSAPF